MTSYPASIGVTRPDRFDRIHLLVRGVFLVVLSLAGLSLGVVFVMAYLALPAIAALLLSQNGTARFFAEDAPRLAGALRWLLSVYAYFLLLCDRLPSGGAELPVRFEVAFSGAPTPKSALMRLILGIPSALGFAILSFFSGIVWVVAAISILISERFPASLYDFQCGVLRWQARLLAYQASLVEPNPPFVFDSGPEDLPAGLGRTHLTR